MSKTSLTQLKCIKCRGTFYHEENLGTLQCYDTYYSNDGNSLFRIKADHLASKFNDQVSSLNWMDYIYTVEHCIDIEVNIFKKLFPQPHKLAVIDPVEFQYLYKQYMDDLIESDIHFLSQTAKPISEAIPKTNDHFEKFEFDSDLSSEEKNSDEESLFSSHVADDDLTNSTQDTIVKEVCVARFDWRERFKILSLIKKMDSKTDYTKYFPHQLIPYNQTQEYSFNEHLRRKFIDSHF